MRYAFDKFFKRNLFLLSCCYADTDDADEASKPFADAVLWVM